MIFKAFIEFEISYEEYSTIFRESIGERKNILE